jgi:hypothetical protein
MQLGKQAGVEVDSHHRERSSVPVTVRDALAMEPLRRARLVAGADGLDREITSVNVMEALSRKSWKLEVAVPQDPLV